MRVTLQRVICHDDGHEETVIDIITLNKNRSYWIPGACAPTLAEKPHLCLRLLKNQGCKEKRLTKVGSYTLGTSTTLASNKSQRTMPAAVLSVPLLGLPMHPGGHTRRDL